MLSTISQGDWSFVCGVQAWRSMLPHAIAAVLDGVMALITHPLTWLAVLVLVLIVDSRLRRGRGRRALLVALIGVAVLDLTGGKLLKPAIGRARPCAASSAASSAASCSLPTLLACPEAPSMPSNHASNSFFVALVLGALYRQSVLLLMACLVGASRVYLGVHFPADVLAGAALGTGAGLLARRLLVPADRTDAHAPVSPAQPEPSTPCAYYS